jgi:hypothetical protein
MRLEGKWRRLFCCRLQQTTSAIETQTILLSFAADHFSNRDSEANTLAKDRLMHIISLYKQIYDNITKRKFLFAQLFHFSLYAEIMFDNQKKNICLIGKIYL